MGQPCRLAAGFIYRNKVLRRSRVPSRRCRPLPDLHRRVSAANPAGFGHPLRRGDGDLVQLRVFVEGEPSAQIDDAVGAKIDRAFAGSAGWKGS